MSYTSSLARRRIFRIITELEAKGKRALRNPHQRFFLDEMIEKRDRINQDGRGLRFSEEEVLILADLEKEYLK